MIVIKKYSNRRLYDTDQSRYITLEELAERIRVGADVQVIDASSGRDLTQATLVQIVLESRGAGRLLPPTLLVAMIRMGDDALADFLGRWMNWALQMYGAARQQASTPFWSGGNPFGAMFGGHSPWGGSPWQAQGPTPGWQGAPGGQWPQPPVQEPPMHQPGIPEPSPPEAAAAPVAAPAPPAEPQDEKIAALRRELAELRESLQGVAGIDKDSDP